MKAVSMTKNIYFSTLHLVWVEISGIKILYILYTAIIGRCVMFFNAARDFWLQNTDHQSPAYMCLKCVFTKSFKILACISEGCSPIKLQKCINTQLMSFLFSTSLKLLSALPTRWPTARLFQINTLLCR